jgi:hypothetical protein
MPAFSTRSKNFAPSKDIRIERLTATRPYLMDVTLSNSTDT